MGMQRTIFFPMNIPPSQFFLASNFYNSRRIIVGWCVSNIVIFLLQKCLGQNQLLTESLPQNKTVFPRKQDVPPPPARLLLRLLSAQQLRPPCLSAPGLPISQEADLKR
jgi:hypothetical protein